MSLAKSSPVVAEHKQPSKTSRWISTWITDWWGIELISWLISALSLLAIVLILEIHKNRPVPEWPLKITINSLISILSQIAQMGMMKPVVECMSQLKWLWFVRKQKLTEFGAFDNASRGPTGSLLLLGKLRGLHLISLGAIITIISITFGPFTQQVVSYPSRLQIVGNATTSSVVNYTGASDLDYSFSSAGIPALLYEGLTNNVQNLSTITPHCSTGNCTFREYSSLGICSSITDLSFSIVNQSCNITALDSFFELGGLKNPGYPCYNYTIPYSGLTSFFDHLDQYTVIGNISLSDAINPMQFSEVLALNILNIAQQTTNSSLAKYLLLYQPNLQNSPSSSTLQTPVAYQISWDLCIHRYNTTVSNGETNTVLISSQNFDTPMNESSANGEIWSTMNAGTFNFEDRGLNFSASYLGLQYITDSIGEVLEPGLCFFNLNLTDLRYPGPGTSFPLPAPNNTFFCLGSFPIALMNLLRNNSDPFVAATTVAENIAISLTNGFRTGAYGDTDIIWMQGKALAPIAFVETQYLWLLLPTAFICLSLIFLFATIIKSQRLGSRVWKSSHLATLQGLHLDLHKKLGGLSSLSEMEEKAELLQVRFDMEGGKAKHSVDYRLIEEKRQYGWSG